MKRPVRMTNGLRTVIDRMYNREDANVETIAAALGTTQQTIYRELRRGRTDEVRNGRFVYDPKKGETVAAEAQLRKGCKLREDDGRVNNGRGRSKVFEDEAV
ncbi:MAG: helix-turn-helix domain-containing protein [Ruminococcaceae bacterium]|nr:helix-turn-helix domain-containing protein [Oscillospiraceae bacterium]